MSVSSDEFQPLAFDDDLSSSDASLPWHARVPSPTPGNGAGHFTLQPSASSAFTQKSRSTAGKAAKPVQTVGETSHSSTLTDTRSSMERNHSKAPTVQSKYSTLSLSLSVCLSLPLFLSHSLSHTLPLFLSE